MRKPKSPQKKNSDSISGRDLFQTPNYAVDLLEPYIPDGVKTIWECAAGQRKIFHRLENCGYDVFASDLQDAFPVNFLTDVSPSDFDGIVTNPPFSLKNEFLLRCVQYDVPFALLVPAEYAIWVIDAVEKYGCEKIVPRRRIDYITPNTLQRIWEGEMFESLNWKQYTFKEFKEARRPDEWERLLNNARQFKYDSIYEAPAKLLRKYSSSYYHSMWLTRYFNLGRTETFVELTNEMKDNI